MKKSKTVKDVANTIPGKIVVCFLALYSAIVFIPALLNAKSDIAVMIGIALIVAIVTCVCMFFRSIMGWIGIDLN